MILGMAAQARTAACQLEDLRTVTAARMQRLLDEETRNWRARLHWDFTSSAELVTRYLGMRALDGLALTAGSEIAGYCYWVAEGHKALIGDLYVREAWRAPEHEQLLLTETLSALRRSHSLPILGVRRVESQLMQLSQPDALQWDEPDQPLRFQRLFMLAPLDAMARYRAIGFERALRFLPWRMEWIDAIAGLIAAVYSRHIDSHINDQYRNTAGAERFLRNVVKFPGCGKFQPEASYVVLSESSDLAGCVIATRVAPETGHIAQLCVAPEWQGRGLGYELLRRSMQALREIGCREVSLTVTAANGPARRLYEHMDFRTIQRFTAFIWDQL